MVTGSMVLAIALTFLVSYVIVGWAEGGVNAREYVKVFFMALGMIPFAWISIMVVYVALCL